jgi:hypothetical protein
MIGDPDFLTGVQIKNVNIIIIVDVRGECQKLVIMGLGRLGVRIWFCGG